MKPLIIILFPFMLIFILISSIFYPKTIKVVANTFKFGSSLTKLRGRYAKVDAQTNELIDKHNEQFNEQKKCHSCICGKMYISNFNLERHKKVCDVNKNNGVSKEVTNEKWIKMDKKWIKMDKLKNVQKCPKSHVCECGKSYVHQSGLSKHKKNCKHIEDEIIQESQLVKYDSESKYDLKITVIVCVNCLRSLCLSLSLSVTAIII